MKFAASLLLLASLSVNASINNAIDLIETQASEMTSEVYTLQGNDVESLLMNYITDVLELDEEDYRLLLSVNNSPSLDIDLYPAEIGHIDIEDAADLIAFPTGRNGRLSSEEYTFLNNIKKALELAKQSGAYIGVSSLGWSTCGMQLPAVFILDVKTKSITIIRPSDTSC